jgi:hypothetical protein
MSRPDRCPTGSDLALAAATDWEAITAGFAPPVLLVSTVVGRGMYSLGEAIQERCSNPAAVSHIAVEDFLPQRAVTEDLRRYKWLSNHLPFLLYLVHTVPVFYYRKYLRERLRSGVDLQELKAKIEAVRPRTVVCISHRPAFWVSSLKKRAGMDFQLWGVLGEYGNTLGWKYIFWDRMNGFLSPLGREELDYPLPDHLAFRRVELPARKEYCELADRPGSSGCVLVVCGYWGQGSFVKLVNQLLAGNNGLKVHVVCGENVSVHEEMRRRFRTNPDVNVHGAVRSLVPLLQEAGCVVTKPGISTLLEAHAARRKIFLVKGIPVSEDNNARYAVRHFAAEWFDPAAFRRWQRTREA